MQVQILMLLLLVHQTILFQLFNGNQIPIISVGKMHQIIQTILEIQQIA